MRNLFFALLLAACASAPTQPPPVAVELAQPSAPLPAPVAAAEAPIQAAADAAAAGACDQQDPAACATDADCACGRDRASGACAVGNVACITTDRPCPDFCSGIDGRMRTACQDGQCVQVHQ